MGSVSLIIKNTAQSESQWQGWDLLIDTIGGWLLKLEFLSLFWWWLSGEQAEQVASLSVVVWLRVCSSYHCVVQRILQWNESLHFLNSFISIRTNRPCIKSHKGWRIAEEKIYVSNNTLFRLIGVFRFSSAGIVDPSSGLSY